MKKHITFLLTLIAFVLILSLAACGGKEEETAQASPSPSAAVSPSAAPLVSPKASATPQRATPSPKASATPAPTEAPTPEPIPEPAPEPDSEPEPEPYQPDDDEDNQVWVQPSGNDEPDTEPETPGVDPYAYIGSDINALYGVCGYPNSAVYGPSCLGAGEDGVLYYDGFTVYTYREDGVETIQDVD